MTEMAEIVTPGLQNWLGTEFPQDSELRSETSAAVPHPTKVSLSQIKVRYTLSEQQSQRVISEIPTG